MAHLSRNDLMSLEEYSNKRIDIRSNVMALKKKRIIPIGPSIMMHFENLEIMQYQVQEMLRVEKVFDADGIQEELDAYNPLIPDGSNWKATQMIEFSDPEVRAVELKKLIGIDGNTYVQVAEHAKVYAISDEDMERENEEKTSSVHFMRFELTAEMVADAKNSAAIKVGSDHSYYTFEHEMDEEQRTSLVADLD